MTNTAFIAAAAACALAAFPANAAGNGTTMFSERVGFADLDLGSKKGRATLERRINWAAARVCSDYERPSPTGLQVNIDCFRAAVRDALAKVDRAIAQRDAGRDLMQSMINLQN